MRMIGVMFLGLTFLAGITVGTVEIALINVVIFCALALAVAKFLEPRFGQNGLVYGMAGAFFASFLWPYVWIMIRSEEGCQGDACLAKDPPSAEVSIA